MDGLLLTFWFWGIVFTSAFVWFYCVRADPVPTEQQLAVAVARTAADLDRKKAQLAEAKEASRPATPLHDA